MRSKTLKPWLLLAVVLAASRPLEVRGQHDAAVRFVTQDGVMLRGQFFGGAKQSPSVLMIHDLGELLYEKQWHAFAQMLHKSGFAVLQFHLRGHGSSTEIDPDLFWSSSFPANRKLVKKQNREEIDFADFHPRYHCYLINDIAAAKAFLDRKNDSGECNSANVILIGCGRGGTLAAAWINSEMFRYRLLPGEFGAVQPQLAMAPEGDSLLGALFINVSTTIGHRKLALGPALLSAARHKIPIVFFYAGDDTASEIMAKDTEKFINPGGRLSFTGTTEIAGTNTADVEKRILTDEKVQKDLVSYMKELQDYRGKEWEERECKEAVYFWRNPYAPASVLQANQAGNNSPVFSGYGWFLPSR